MPAIEIEISTDKCDNVAFLPLNKAVRGRMDFSKLTRNRAASTMLNEWPGPIPGQVIGIDPVTGKAWLREPLYEAKHATLKRKIEKSYELPPEREEYPTAHVPTWLFWLRRLVDSNHAQVISGELPALDKIEGEPVTSMFRERKNENAGAIDKLCGTVEKLCGLVATLLTTKGK